jgi:hypothetical protein
LVGVATEVTQAETAKARHTMINIALHAQKRLIGIVVDNIGYSLLYRYWWRRIAKINSRDPVGRGSQFNITIPKSCEVLIPRVRF